MLMPAPDVDVNQQAAQFLSSLGPRAAAAVPALVETLRARRFSRSHVSYALQRIGVADDAVRLALREAAQEASGSTLHSIRQALEALDAIAAGTPSPTKDGSR